MRVAIAVLAAGLLWAQSETSEDEALRKALADSSSSTVDLVAALENHLRRFPQTKRQFELYRAILRAAIELKDDKRIAEYGPRVLAVDSSDPRFLDRVTRALLTAGGPANAAKALEYAQALEKSIAPLLSAEGADAGRRRDEAERALSRAALYQANALYMLKRVPEAVAAASRAYGVYPSAEGARESAKLAQVEGRIPDAIRLWAEAFMIPDMHATEADRAIARRALGDLHRAANPAGAGLGELVLAAYDRAAAALAERRLRLNALDPNAQAANVLDFTLSGLDGRKLPLSGLKGKVVVLDFWATWCEPCRAQHPLYDEVRTKFAGRDDVVFLALNTDEERSLVAPFVQEHKWNRSNIYYEDGLSRLLQVTAIPTTVLVSRDGRIASRMNGFIADRFVEVLSERIADALR